ncbi:hypothetical protein MARPO_0020s0068, partial [Marchantia polymorpha]
IIVFVIGNIQSISGCITRRLRKSHLRVYVPFFRKTKEVSKAPFASNKIILLLLSYFFYFFVITHYFTIHLGSSS